jgi:hypothetical protein
VIPRKTLDGELVTTGLTHEKVENYVQKDLFVDIDIFTDWCRETLLRRLETTSGKMELPGSGVRYPRQL